MVSPRAGVLNRGYLYPLGVRNTKAGEMRRQNNGYLKHKGSGSQTFLSAGTGKWLITVRGTPTSEM